MKLKQAIAAAQAMRPGTMDEPELAAALWRLDGELAEHLGASAPAAAYPDDRDLLMKPPFDDLYPLYLACAIDRRNGDDDALASDVERYNARLDEALCHVRRGAAKPSARFCW